MLIVLGGILIAINTPLPTTNHHQASSSKYSHVSAPPPWFFSSHAEFQPNGCGSIHWSPHVNTYEYCFNRPFGDHPENQHLHIFCLFLCNQSILVRKATDPNHCTSSSAPRLRHPGLRGRDKGAVTVKRRMFVEVMSSLPYAYNIYLYIHIYTYIGSDLHNCTHISIWICINISKCILAYTGIYVHKRHQS